jgi:uncharacterized phage-associated protein
LPHPTLAIANEFLGRAFEEGRGLTQMQLQKLVYLAHGWNLAVNGEQLVEDEFEAWSYGPVLRRLYDATRIYSNNKIPALLKWGQDTPFRSDDGGDALTNLDDKERSVIDEVWELMESSRPLSYPRLLMLTVVRGLIIMSLARTGRFLMIK